MYSLFKHVYYFIFPFRFFPVSDVLLMHPWLIHSGTLNMGTRPRLMANGMARIKQEAFKHHGARILQ